MTEVLALVLGFVIAGVAYAIGHKRGEKSGRASGLRAAAATYDAPPAPELKPGATTPFHVSGIDHNFVVRSVHFDGSTQAVHVDLQDVDTYVKERTL